ncbi:MAG: YjjG family noncanonical pyrimidine nucleotidase [Clostridia bacterium]|nr:YjjG family noncanonical pyrimidine nucleotidase [Clostridia bacterium]MDD4386741.1 YjjG family noncanonical pyrimidine nucleotidase [Clostridia bacterium]
MENIKVVFFDADNTLIDHKECERQALVYLFNNMEVEYKEEYQNIFSPLDRELWDSIAHGTCTVSKEDIPQYRFKKFFEVLDIKYDNFYEANKLFQDGLSNSSALLNNAEEIVKYLYDKGYKLYVVTNGLVRLQKPRIMNSRISEFISDILVSEEVGAYKPDPKIFNILLDRIKMNTNNVIMIGDSLEKDIQGAKNANIKSIWYNYKNKKNETSILPDYEISNLLDVKDIL